MRSVTAAVAPPPIIAPGRNVLEAWAVIDVTVAIAHFRTRHPVAGGIIRIVAPLLIPPGAGVVAIDARAAANRRFWRIDAITVGVSTVRQGRCRLHPGKQHGA